ncbi:MAG TPA: hypothetical protein VHF58_07520, partial [Solirubrobacterales bacterium]|nr:hypothetical protein [Solirubrobacterales bacterium]
TALFHDQESEGGSEAALAESPPAAESPAFEVEESPLEATERPASEGETIAELAGEPTVEHDTLGAEGKAENVDLDLDLNLDEEVEDAEGVEELELDDEDVEATGGEQAAPAVAGTAEDPVESLDTVEHHFEDAVDEAEVVEDEPTSLLEDSDDDDVLEETPEFLRDAPEDDELWFEQGEPKDFDF